MNAPDGQAARRRRVDVAVFVCTLALAAWLRWRHAADRELWLDDMTRVRLARLPWSALFASLPFLDPLKSPYLIGLHKLWTECFGDASLLAMRSYGAALGVAVVAAVFPVARAALGRVGAHAACVVYAVHPFFVRWSIELHDYAPAVIATSLCAAIAFSPRPTTRAAAATFGALAGFSVGVFPPSAAALATIALCAGMTKPRDRVAWGLAAAAAAVVAAPALVAIARSAALHRPAYDAGLAWSPYFSVKRTPFEVLARMGGLDVRQGAGGASLALGATAVIVAAAVSLALSPRRRDDPENWRRRAALFVAGVLPLVVLCAASMRGVGVFNDRYAHGAAALLPLGLLASVEFPRSAVVRAAGAVVVAGLGTALVVGAWEMFDAGAAFPRDSSPYLYRCDALTKRELAKETPPAVLLVHGEAQTSQMLLRMSPGDLARIDVRHLTTAAWRRAQRDDDRSRVSIPHAHGWPWAVAELAGRDVSVDRDEARPLLRNAGGCWVLLERERVIRMRLLEEEETPDLDLAYALLEKPADADRDARIAAAVARYLRLADDLRIRTASDGPAILVKISVR